MQHLNIFFLASFSWPSGCPSRLYLFCFHWLCLCVYIWVIWVSLHLLSFHPICEFLRVQDGKWGVFSPYDMPLWLQCPLHTRSSVKFTVLTACQPHTPGWQAKGLWEPFGEWLAFISHFLRILPIACFRMKSQVLFYRHCLFDPEFCTRGFSSSYQCFLVGGWEKGREEGCFVCLGLEDKCFFSNSNFSLTFPSQQGQVIFVS